MTLLEQYKARNRAALVPVGVELKALGFEVLEREFGLRCELKFGDVLTGYAYFVSAGFLFSLEQQPKGEDEDEIEREQREKGQRHFPSDFKRFQRTLMDEVRQTTPYPECYLFVIGEEGEILNDIDSRKRMLVENNEDLARKFVLTLAQARVMLTNPFEIRQRGADVEGPTFDTVQELVYLEDDAPEVDVALTSQLVNIMEADAKLLAEARYADVRSRIEGILYRVMGPEFKVFWSPDGVQIGRIWDARGAELPYVSEGERRVFAFAHFLATGGLEMQPGMRLGIYGLLNGLGVIPYVGAVNVLREYVFATGVSVRLQIPQRDRRDSARYRMKAVATILEVAQHPFC